jgi:peptidoglycan/LPS O-acetylase OafA/YrhL
MVKHQTNSGAANRSRPDSGSKAQGDGARLLGVQALRAVGALLVAWAHAIDEVQGSLGNPLQARFFYFENFGSSGLDIFFVISGFVVSLVAARAANRDKESSGSSAVHFLSRRITRIFPLFLMITAFLLARVLKAGRLHEAKISWLPTLLLLPSFDFPASGPLLSLGWSLIFELYFYLLLAAFLLFTKRSVVRSTVTFLCGMVALGLIAGFRHPLLIFWMNPLILEFVFGCLIGLLFDRCSKANLSFGRLGLGLAALGVALLAATVFTGYGAASAATSILAGQDCWLRVAVWGLPSALLVGGVIFCAPAMRSVPARLLVFLGDASYSIYLCTIPALDVIRRFWRHFGSPGADVGVFQGILSCVVAGVVCYLIVERPLMRFFHNWYKPIPFHAKQA